MKALYTILLLVVSNVFMTFAWYGHLKLQQMKLIDSWPLYLVLPNTKVRLRSAIMASVIAGTCFFIFQSLYVYLIKWMTSYNAIYGSFAALPLFMLWMQNSWSILLIGCELSFAIQNEKRFDEERTLPALSLDVSRKLMLAIVAYVARAFRRGEGAVPMIAIRQALGLPTRIASKLIAKLVAAEVLNEVRCEEEDYDVAYAPARDVATMSVCDVLEAVDGYVDGATEQLCNTALCQRAVAEVDALKSISSQSKENKLVIELAEDE